MMSKTDRAAEEHLPLRPVEFQVLVGLAAGPRHGYAILKAAEDSGRRGGVPGLTTLYRTLRRLEDGGLITTVEPTETDEADLERRRTFELTELGRTVARAEAERLDGLLSSARKSRLLSP